MNVFDISLFFIFKFDKLKGSLKQASGTVYKVTSLDFVFSFAFLSSSLAFSSEKGFSGPYTHKVTDKNDHANEDLDNTERDENIYSDHAEKEEPVDSEAIPIDEDIKNSEKARKEQKNRLSKDYKNQHKTEKREMEQEKSHLSIENLMQKQQLSPEQESKKLGIACVKCKDILSSRLPQSKDGKMNMVAQVCYALCLAEYILEFHKKAAEESGNKEKITLLEAKLRSIRSINETLLTAISVSYQAFGNDDFVEKLDKECQNDKDAIDPENMESPIDSSR
ncbi:hypothetical protein [Candidatus Hydrogenosomobacter endosymbioticus]|uniref:Uncharacterized protein n=1 Tax=Candidatus Hydrogenosomobacter endosymbioticus TaxID=2558174 RepID=A0ABN6L3A3_9PROT|nr:hypothetical protein [Candidatus Hydrogenosomobacter endosymbioticus]BDB96341.1 hypothetical protein HYD_4740 [Candidatus Hydrogenosomobacter endosymbioticus]